MICIKNGKIHNAIDKEAFIADILIDNGKIKEIASDINVSDSTEIIDATGKEVYPGFVEAHCHLGIAGKSGYGAQAGDHNEKNDATTPHLRAIDSFDPFDSNIKRAREAGVTCVCTGPGSANVIGGTFTALKTVGKRVDKMTVKNEVAMKCAFGENPKTFHGNKCDCTRMTTAAILREILSKARRYKMMVDAANGDETKYPAFDAKLNALLPVIRGEMPLKAHAHQANDIFTAIRIAEEFGVKLTLEHVTEGHLIADELAEAGYPLAVGPTLCNGSKFELRNKSWETPGVLAKAGCHVCIITDSTVTCQEYLPVCAGYAIKAGMDSFDALRAITINAAEHIGIADRVGSLEVGKDADIVITDGSPFEIATRVEKVLIDGKVVVN